MLNNLFGVELSYIAQFFLAFLIVLALIVGTFWLIRRFGANRMGGDKARGRQPRLAVIDAAAVDSRRRLILIRRDNVEHLMMIGGPSDVVIEQNIVRAVPVAPAREAPPTRGPGETVTRGTDLVRPEPLPRPAAPEATWSPPPLPEGIRPRAEPASRASEPARPLPESLSPSRVPMSDPRPSPRATADLQPVEVRQSPPTADVNLADMAQRLEAALRRPGQAPDARTEPSPRPAPPREPLARSAPPPRTVPAPETIMPPIPRVTPPRPMSPPPEPAAPPVARSAQPPNVPSANAPSANALSASAPPPNAPSASAPSASVPPPSAPSPSVEPVRAPEPAPMQAPPQPPAASAEAPAPKPEPPPAKPKTVFDSLEEEMASLLGRPPDKS
jgi:flagellar protein FliO/FliZ